MTRLHLVRHGPTHAKSMVGWSDLPADLTDSGLLSRLSVQLPADALVVSSDLIRAADTATAIQGSRPRLPNRPGLREINFGDWELRRYAEIEAEDPVRARAYWETPGDVSPPGGESWRQVCARVNDEIDALTASHPDTDLIVVGHFGMILTQVQRALAITAEQVFSHRIDNLSITEITRTPDGWTVGRINHLV